MTYDAPSHGLYYVRTYGEHPGLVLTPIVIDGCYIVGVKNTDEIRAPRSQVPDLLAYLRETGYRVRMGAAGHRPSLIHWTSIQGSECAVSSPESDHNRDINPGENG